MQKQQNNAIEYWMTCCTAAKIWVHWIQIMYSTPCTLSAYRQHYKIWQITEPKGLKFNLSICIACLFGFCTALFNCLILQELIVPCVIDGGDNNAVCLWIGSLDVRTLIVLWRRHSLTPATSHRDLLTEQLIARVLVTVQWCSTGRCRRGARMPRSVQ